MSVRRFAAIGDVHAEHDRLAAALNRLAMFRLDAVLCVGDVVDGRGDAARCCKLLQKHRVITVRGNHERWLVNGEMRDLPDSTAEITMDVANWAFIAQLPPTRRIETMLGPLLLCHGIGEDDMARLLPDEPVPEGLALTQLLASDYEIVVGGHTHRRMVRGVSGLTFINAGTLAPDHGAHVLVCDLEERAVEFLDFDANDRLVEGPRYVFGRPGDDIWGGNW